MSLNIPMPTATDINRLTYLGAARLKEVMSNPGGQTEELDYSVMPSCFNCDGPMYMGQKPLVCSACRSAVYCSKKCQVANWKTGRFGTEGHKIFCEKNKRHMLRVPQVRAILKLFPWGRLESDGTFAESLIRAYFGVLGAQGYGYWSEAGSAPHQFQPNTMSNHNNPFCVDPVESYQDGYLLLLDRHLDDKEGWKLEDRFIPKLHFEPGCEPVTGLPVNVIDWKSWYQWRSLPFDSPAALLMHYPLTVYHLLVGVLKVASPGRGSSESRQTLDIHYLGAEVELNMLPLFSELALLLPHTDIKLTLFGDAVRTIVQKAKKKSVAAKARQNEPVYAYKGPTSMGHSTLTIYLDGEHENWDPRFASITNNLPDAVIALNAGLLSYKAWASVILFCHVEEMPFGVTEYAEQSAEVQRDSFSKIIHHAIPSLAPRMSTVQLEDLVKPRQYLIEFNPFQRPGQRAIGSTRLPNVSNGFTIRVIGRDSWKESKEDSLPVVWEASDMQTENRPLINKTGGISLDASAEGAIQSSRPSTGNPHMPYIYIHGLPLSCSVAVLAPDSQSAYGELVQKYFIAQGIASGHNVCIVDEDALSLAKECMWTPVLNTNEPEEDGAVQSEEKIKIAWRYGQMKKSEPTMTSLDTDNFCDTFDLTLRVPMSVIDDAYDANRLVPLNLTIENDLASSMDGVVRKMKHVLASTPSTTVVRLCVVALGSPKWGECCSEDILRILYELRRLLRQYPHGCACVTLAPHLCTGALGGPGWVEKLGWVTDGTISMSGFGANPALTALFPSHHGLVQIHKLPAPHSILAASDKYSTLRGLSSSAGLLIGTGENNLAFRCTRKRLVFETMHLDLEGGVAERRTRPSSSAGVGQVPTDVNTTALAQARVAVELDAGSLEGQSTESGATDARPRRAKKRVAFRSDKLDLYEF